MADNKVDVEVAVSVTGQQDLQGLSPTLQQVGQQVGQLQAQGQAAGAGLDAAAAAARNAGQAGAQAAAGVAQAAQGLAQEGSAASSAAGKLDQTAAAARAAGQASGQAATGAQQAAQGLAQAGNVAQEATGKLAQTRRGMQSISTQLAEMREKMGTLETAMTGLFAASKLKSMALSAIDLANAYNQMAERIKMATPIASEYEGVQQRILETANLTYRPLAEQQELYIRTADALRSLAYTTGQALDITDSFSYLLTTNAASGERAQNAIDAYSKSIQSGKVDVQSWQSMLAATPTLVDAVASATGKSAAQIRQMGITGNLALRDLNEGLRQSVEANKAAAGQMKATLNDALTRLSNTWQKYVGEVDQAHGITDKMVGLLDTLSEHLDTVVRVAGTVGEVILVALGAKALAALKGYAVQLGLAVKETLALAAATDTAAMAANKLGTASNMLMAGIVGWQIGTWLSEQFAIARKAGVALIQVLMNGAALVQGAWELVRATFTSETYAQAFDKIKQRMAEMNATFAQMYKDAENAAQGQKDAAAATAAAADKSGQAASAAAGQWAALQAAVKTGNEQIQKYGELLQKTGAARVAEAQTAVQLAQAFGDEAQKRRAAADAAQVQAEQTRALANVRQSEVTALESERAAIMELDKSYRDSNADVQERLKALGETIALRQAEADAAAAQAAQSEVAAAAAQVEAEKLKDNSARVDELRAAHERARAALEQTQAAYKAGKASLQDLNKAQIEAAKSAALLADAIDDQRAKLEAKNRAQQAALSLQEMGVRVAIEEWRAIKEVAKARGDEETVMRAQNEIRKLEIELLELQAQAKRAQAQAQLAAVEAERAELIASGQMTEQKRLELDAAIKSAQVKEKEAQIADITASKLRQLAAAEDESGNAADRAADKHQRNAEGIDAQARATDKLTDAQLRARGITRNADGTYSKGGIRVTEDGWAADAHGNAIAGKNDLGTLTGIYDFLKSAGVDDEAAARRIALEFSDGKGGVPILSNPGQVKYRKTQYDSLSTAVLYAAEQYTFGLDKGNYATHKGATTGATTPAATPASAAPSPAASASTAAATTARTVNVNLNLGGQRVGQVATDDQGAASIEAFMRALENDKRLSGRY